MFCVLLLPYCTPNASLMLSICTVDKGSNKKGDVIPLIASNLLSNPVRSGGVSLGMGQPGLNVTDVTDVTRGAWAGGMALSADAEGDQSVGRVSLKILIILIAFQGTQSDRLDYLRR